MPSEVEIGVWVDGVQKWVTGVTKRTTCEDIIKALLRTESQTTQDIKEFVIVERWRKVERPLDQEQKILKIWRAWGEDISEVRFTLRRKESDSEAERRLDRSQGKYINKQFNPDYHAKSGDSAMENHDATFQMAIPTNSRIDTMERLMRLVTAQGKTIQTQLRHMRERDEQIEKFEQQLHLLRVQSLGPDYLWQSYLKDHQSENTQLTQALSKELVCELRSNDSGMITEDVTDTETRHDPIEQQKGIDDLDDLSNVGEKMEILDKLEGILLRLLEYEEALTKLEHLVIRSKVEHLEVEIEESTRVHAITLASESCNEQRLCELERALLQRRVTLEVLCEEDIRSEKEMLAKQAQLEYIIHLPPTAFKLPRHDASSLRSPTSSNIQLPIPPNPSSLEKFNNFPYKSQNVFRGDMIPSTVDRKEYPWIRGSAATPRLPIAISSPLDQDEDKGSGKINNSPSGLSLSTRFPQEIDATDSNSDTGLSSLHSSSDEAFYALATRV